MTLNKRASGPALFRHVLSPTEDEAYVALIQDWEDVLSRSRRTTKFAYGAPPRCGPAGASPLGGGEYRPGGGVVIILGGPCMSLNIIILLSSWAGPISETKIFPGVTFCTFQSRVGRMMPFSRMIVLAFEGNHPRVRMISG